MRASRVRRWLLRGAVLATVVLLIAVAATRLVPEERVRDFLVARVEEATGAEVEIGGARLRTGLGLGLRLADSRIVGNGTTLAAATGSSNEIGPYELVLERADVTLALLPLLKRQAVVDAIRVLSPRCTVVHRGREIVVEALDLTVRDLAWSLDAGTARRDASGGSGSLEVGTPPGATIPADLSLTFDLHAGRVDWQGVIYGEVEAAGELAERVVTVRRVETRRGAGRISGDATLDYAVDPWGELVFTAEVDAVPAGELLQAWLPELARRLECALSGRANGRCRLRDAETVRRTLDLTGTLLGSSGVLHAADWLDDVAPYLGRRQDLKDIDFTELHHESRIAGGLYLVDELRLSGGQSEWTGSGAVSLDGQMDLGLHVRLPAGFSPELGQWSFLAASLRDGDGRVNLDFRLNGDAARPQVKVDLNRLLGRAGGGDGR